MELVKGLLGSKKFVATMIGVAVTIAINLGLDPVLAKEIVPVVMTLIASYVVGQGIADHGKEAAKVHAAAAAAFDAGADPEPAAEG